MKSKTELLKHVKMYAPRGGMRVNVLKESWSGAPTAIDELERENEVIVLRGKDGQGMRTVFENNIKDAIDVEQRNYKTYLTKIVKLFNKTLFRLQRYLAWFACT